MLARLKPFDVSGHRGNQPFFDITTSFDAFFALLLSITVQATLFLNVTFSSTFDSTFCRVRLRLDTGDKRGLQKLLANPVHVFPLPVFLQVDHHQKYVSMAGDEDVLVLHLDVVHLLKGVFEEASHSSYGATYLEGLEQR